MAWSLALIRLLELLDLAHEVWKAVIMAFDESVFCSLSACSPLADSYALFTLICHGSSLFEAKSNSQVSYQALGLYAARYPLQSPLYMWARNIEDS